ncbi:MAG: protein-disulfide reductase DsbD domain-containing protein [Bacteroidota bacterium]
MGIIRLLLSITFCALAVATISAQQDPVSWDFSTERIGNDTYTIKLEGTIDAGWFIYSQFLGQEDGPIPTTVYIEPQKNAIELVGLVEEKGNRKEGFDPVFEVNLVKFSKQVTFTQTIKLRGGDANQITGYIEYMTCNDESCLPPKEVPFTLELDRS